MISWLHHPNYISSSESSTQSVHLFFSILFSIFSWCFKSHAFPRGQTCPVQHPPRKRTSARSAILATTPKLVHARWGSQRAPSWELMINQSLGAITIADFLTTLLYSLWIGLFRCVYSWLMCIPCHNHYHHSLVYTHSGSISSRPHSSPSPGIMVFYREIIPVYALI